MSSVEEILSKLKEVAQQQQVKINISPPCDFIPGCNTKHTISVCTNDVQSLLRCGGETLQEFKWDEVEKWWSTPNKEILLGSGSGK